MMKNTRIKKQKKTRSLFETTKFAKKPQVFIEQYIPENIKFRDDQMKTIALTIKNRNNLLVRGKTGIGKTATIRRIVLLYYDTYPEPSDFIFHIDCASQRRIKGVAESMADTLLKQYSKRDSADRLFRYIQKTAEKGNLGLITVLDEADKLTDFEKTFRAIDGIRSSVICVTNDFTFGMALPEEVKNRLGWSICFFPPYTMAQAEEILRDRCKLGGLKNYDGAIIPCILAKINQITDGEGDLRLALKLLRFTIEFAEGENAKKITTEDVEEAFKRMETQMLFTSLETLTPTQQYVLYRLADKPYLIKNLYEKYRSDMEEIIVYLKSYKTFHSHIADLEKSYRLICMHHTGGRGRSNRISSLIEKDLYEKYDLKEMLKKKLGIEREHA